MARPSTAGGVISGKLVLVGSMLPTACVERRFGNVRTPHLIQWLVDDGSPCTARDTVNFVTTMDLVSYFTPIRGPKSNEVCEGFVKNSSAIVS